LLRAELSAPLLKNIFYERAPMHDGAAIISGDLIIEAAGCRLPLSDSEEIPADVGMRHRAGVGISENSDAIVVIVSEETGIISVALDGKLERYFDIYTLKKKLTALLLEHFANAKAPKNKKNKKSE
jgi:diadenylate cyclase